MSVMHGQSLSSELGLKCRSADLLCEFSIRTVVFLFAVSSVVLFTVNFVYFKSILHQKVT